MFDNSKHSYLYYSAIGIMIALVYFIQTSTSLIPPVFGVRPMPAYVLMICFAMFGGEWAGITAGLLLGIATDTVSAAPDGFNALFMMLAGLIAALLSTYLFNRRLPAAMVLTAGACAVYYFMYWLVRLVPAGGDASVLLRYSLPSAIYSWVFVFPFWALIHFISHPHKKKKKTWDNILE